MLWLRQRLAERPELFLFLLAAAMPLAFRSWQALLNNFAIERAGFTGVEIGILQSLREIPGLLAFTVVFVLLLVREQTLAVVSLIVLGTSSTASLYELLPRLLKGEGPNVKLVQACSWELFRIGLRDTQCVAGTSGKTV